MNRRRFIRGLVRVAPVVVVPATALETLGRSMVGWGRELEPAWVHMGYTRMPITWGQASNDVADDILWTASGAGNVIAWSIQMMDGTWQHGNYSLSGFSPP